MGPPRSSLHDVSHKGQTGPDHTDLAHPCGLRLSPSRPLPGLPLGLHDGPRGSRVDSGHGGPHLPALSALGQRSPKLQPERAHRGREEVRVIFQGKGILR